MNDAMNVCDLQLQTGVRSEVTEVRSERGDTDYSEERRVLKRMIRIQNPKDRMVILKGSGVALLGFVE